MASIESAYKLYKRNVHIAYDPTEGIVKMEVTATEPQLSADFAKALIRYAEEQVDHLTQRLRGDQMEGAIKSMQSSETNLKEAQARAVEIQERYKVLSSEVEVTLITAQIGQLDTQLSQDRLSLATNGIEREPQSGPDGAFEAPDRGPGRRDRVAAVQADGKQCG